jgi:hypothetical protein
MWLVLETPRDTLLNLAIWLETQGSPDDDDLENLPRAEVRADSEGANET